MTEFLEALFLLNHSFYAISFTLVVFFAIRWILNRYTKGKSGWNILRRSILITIVLIGIVAVVLALPVKDETKGNIFTFIGFLLSAIFTLSSATFMGNGLAGIMLRAINSFRPGDFIRTNEHFGRVSERGLYHTEIQTENRDLVTIPNLYLTTHPVRVTRSSGTFISAQCSLGYDVHRVKIKMALLKAAETADLKDSFVNIVELGDYSVVYKVFGLLKEVKTIISAESRLKACVLDALHEAGIEIVSPSFMNQRQIAGDVFIPRKAKKAEQEKIDNAEKPEDIIFDKAEEAETFENQKQRVEDIDQKIKECQEELKTTDDPEDMKRRIERWTAIREKLLEKIDEQSEEKNNKK